MMTMKVTAGLIAAAMLTALPGLSHAGAMDQLRDAAEHGQAAVEAPSQEEAKDQSNQPFDYDTHDASAEGASSGDTPDE